ncbi:MAG TPA: hypothetical protein VK348_11065 [Planctomycetota bacterium]|nr:hypothetical protein [Planctomycetota bacterium]
MLPPYWNWIRSSGGSILVRSRRSSSRPVSSPSVANSARPSRSTSRKARRWNCCSASAIAVIVAITVRSFLVLFRCTSRGTVAPARMPNTVTAITVLVRVKPAWFLLVEIVMRASSKVLSAHRPSAGARPCGSGARAGGSDVLVTALRLKPLAPRSCRCHRRQGPRRQNGIAGLSRRGTLLVAVPLDHRDASLRPVIRHCSVGPSRWRCRQPVDDRQQRRALPDRHAVIAARIQNDHCLPRQETSRFRGNDMASDCMHAIRGHRCSVVFVMPLPRVGLRRGSCSGPPSRASRLTSHAPRASIRAHDRTDDQ